MRYYLWDLAGGGLLDTFATEAEALSWVRLYLEEEGVDYVENLALDIPDPQGGRTVIAQGSDLASLARTVPAAVG